KSRACIQNRLRCALGRFFRMPVLCNWCVFPSGHVNNIVQNWLPALDGVEAKLKSGAKVADVGCGVGFSTLLMAQAFPNSSFVGFDFHLLRARSESACRRARDERSHQL